MKTAGKEFDHSLRGKTDKSLKHERSKTDQHLREKKSAVERITSASIQHGRITADKTRDQKRAKVDSERKAVRRKNPGRSTSASDDKSLVHERSRTDAAQAAEREKEDMLRARERFQKRLISEALLESERKETDTNLLEERSKLDSHSLSSEKALNISRTELVTRDHFVAVVSHDLRNPLNSISLNADLLRRSLPANLPNTARLSRYLDGIERSAANMDRMICDLLDVERMANGKLTLNLAPTDACALLRECKEIFAPVVASKKFKMTVDTCPEPVYANLDRDRILQVLSNLIGNSLKFTPHGGTIHLSTRKNSKLIEISVADNGPGIPKEKMREIFSRFSQLGTDDRRGLGLGLFISKWVVEAHHGRIKVRSKVGKGSVFSFTLPLALD